MTQADLARKLIERYPTLSKKKLGELLYSSNKAMFKNSESGRSAIRAVTGSLGKNKIKPTHEIIYKGVNLKEGIRNVFTPYIIAGNNIGIISDVHIPFHDLKAINLALNYLKGKKINTLVLLGDMIDAFKISKYETDPNHRISTWEELRMFIGFLTDLRNNFPKAEIVYKLGNHDERYEVFLQQKAPELLDFEVLDLYYLINHHGKSDEERELAKKRNIKIVSQKRILKAGKLNLVHGHEFGKAMMAPVNPARGFYLRAKANTIGGHHHQTSEHIEKDLNNNVTGCWSIGCLSDLHPAYMPINKFNLGFARVVVEKDGNFSVENKKIMNYKIA